MIANTPAGGRVGPGVIVSVGVGDSGVTVSVGWEAVGVKVGLEMKVIVINGEGLG